MVPHVGFDKILMLELFSFVEDLDYIAVKDVYFRKRAMRREILRKFG